MNMLTSVRTFPPSHRVNPFFGAMAKPDRLDLVRQIQEPHDLEIVQSDADDALLTLGRA